MSRVLLLAQSFVPLKVIGWDRAVMMVYTGKAEVVEETDEVVYRKGELVIMMPSVVKLNKPVSGTKRAVKFSRINVFTRDGFRCCYCGSPKPMKAMNYDHVVPRDQGGRTVWENIVSSCYPCNSRKANRTPEQAGMKLLRKPHRPKSLPHVGPRFDPRDIPPAWADYCRDFFVQEDVA